MEQGGVMRALVVGGFAPSLLTFRGPLLAAMRRQDIAVIACAAEGDPVVASTLASLGVRYLPVPVNRTGLNPSGDRVYLRSLCELIRQEQIDILLAYTHKPVVYSALALGGLTPRPRMFAMITGLGFAFIEGGGVRKHIAGAVLRWLYRRASRHFTGVIFQNADDQSLFQQLKLVRPETPQVVVRGSGIDLEEFAHAPLRDANKAENEKLKAEILPSDQDTVVRGQSSVASQVSGFRFQLSAFPVRFLLIARLLGDKGIREYVEAARRIRADHPNAEFHLVGPTDPNPAAISLREVEAWQREGVIVYHGSQKDVRPILRECAVYVLPSYREGTPRTVLEAMATGRAVITTDAPGCRETILDASTPDADGVRQGGNGFLVPVKSVDALVAAMRRFIDSPELAVEMGKEGRRLAEEYYDVHKVNQQILEFMGLAPRSSGETVKR